MTLRGAFKKILMMLIKRRRLNFSNKCIDTFCVAVIIFVKLNIMQVQGKPNRRLNFRGATIKSTKPIEGYQNMCYKMMLNYYQMEKHTRPHIEFDYGKDPHLSLRKFYQCREHAEFIVIAGKFNMIFPKNTLQLNAISGITAQDIFHINNLSIESFYAQTKRKLFNRYFMRIRFPAFTLSPPISQKSARQFPNFQKYITFIIQKDPASRELQFKCFTCEGLLFSTTSNINTVFLQKDLSKLFQKIKEIQLVYCILNYQFGQVDFGLVQQLFLTFKKVVIYGSTNQYETELSQNYVSQQIDIEQFGRIHMIRGPNRIFICKQYQSLKDIITIKSIYYEYLHIDNKIFPQQINPKLPMNIFHENQFCVEIYGILYNLVKFANYMNLRAYQIYSIFLMRLFQARDIVKKKEIEDRRKNNRIEEEMVNEKVMLGHYPEKLQIKGSKVCKVCQSTNHKSRYKCQLCSKILKKQIALCLHHFGEFHKNMPKYMPKEAKKGAYASELSKIKEITDSKSSIIKSNQERKAAEQIYIDHQKFIHQNSYLVPHLEYYHYDKVKEEMKDGMENVKLNFGFYPKNFPEYIPEIPPIHLESFPGSCVKREQFDFPPKGNLLFMDPSQFFFEQQQQQQYQMGQKPQFPLFRKGPIKPYRQELYEPHPPFPFQPEIPMKFREQQHLQKNVKIQQQPIPFDKNQQDQNNQRPGDKDESYDSNEFNLNYRDAQQEYYYKLQKQGQQNMQQQGLIDEQEDKLYDQIQQNIQNPGQNPAEKGQNRQDLQQGQIQQNAEQPKIKQNIEQQLQIQKSNMQQQQFVENEPEMIKQQQLQDQQIVENPEPNDNDNDGDETIKNPEKSKKIIKSPKRKSKRNKALKKKSAEDEDEDEDE